MQWSVVPVVSGIGVCTLTQEEADNFCMAERAGVVQGDESSIIPGMHIGPCLQEMLHHIFPAKTWKQRD